MPGRGPKKRGSCGDTAENLRSLPALLPANEPTGNDPWFPPSLNPRSLFSSPAPIELEVGCGKGLFLASAARNEPDRNYLGIELASGYAQLTAARCAALGLANAQVIAGDAMLMIRSLLEDCCVHAVHVYFPDPWWKARHRKRRVLCEPFFRQAARILVPAGTVHVWTDVEEYFLEAMQAAAATRLFQLPQIVPEQDAQHDFDYRTHFERRTRLANKPVWRAQLQRSDATPPKRRPITPHERVRLRKAGVSDATK